MDMDDAMKTLASVQMARDHATCGRHGAATALLMKVCLYLLRCWFESRLGTGFLRLAIPAVLLLSQM